MASYRFRQEAGDGASVIAHWPADTELASAANRPTVLFFMHPKCPCTRASVAELERLWVLTKYDAAHAPQLIVVATIPADGAEDWTTSGTIERATSLPGSRLFIDRQGIEARRFGVATSGTVMWFDAQGRRLYAGGITAGRGHEGDNAGRETLAGLMRGSESPAFGVPAFGCRLCLPNANAAAVTRTELEQSIDTTHDG